MVICSGNVIFEPETWKTGSGLNRLNSSVCEWAMSRRRLRTSSCEHTQLPPLRVHSTHAFSRWKSQRMTLDSISNNILKHLAVINGCKNNTCYLNALFHIASVLSMRYVTLFQTSIHAFTSYHWTLPPGRRFLPHRSRPWSGRASNQDSSPWTPEVPL